MNTKQLSSWVDESETHQKIVGDYDGSYALGVTDDPPAFLLRVEPTDVASKDLYDGPEGTLRLAVGQEIPCDFVPKPWKPLQISWLVGFVDSYR